MTDLREVLLSLADPPVAEPAPVAELERRRLRRRYRRLAGRGAALAACLLVMGAGIVSLDRAQDATPAAAPDVAVTVAPPTSPSTTAVKDPSACRNSYNASCGPFRWDPEPPSVPIDVRVTADPVTLRAGQPVTFTVQVRRAAGSARQIAAESGDGGSPRPRDGWGCGGPALSPRFGAWDLPSAAPFEATATYTWTYAAAGTYTARFAFDTWTCNGQYAPEYPGRGEATITVTVQR